MQTKTDMWTVSLAITDHTGRKWTQDMQLAEDEMPRFVTSMLYSRNANDATFLMVELMNVIYLFFKGLMGTSGGKKSPVKLELVKK